MMELGRFWAVSPSPGGQQVGPSRDVRTCCFADEPGWKTSIKKIQEGAAANTSDLAARATSAELERMNIEALGHIDVKMQAAALASIQASRKRSATDAGPSGAAAAPSGAAGPADMDVDLDDIDVEAQAAELAHIQAAKARRRDAGGPSAGPSSGAS